jgi:hypothetical protein
MMTSVLRTLAVMVVAPPVVLLIWAHFLRPTFSGLDLLAVLCAGALGLIGVITGPWSGMTRTIVAVCYIVVSLAALPFLTLLAVCSTGDCL